MKLLPNVEVVDRLAYQNVVRKRSSFHYSEMEEHMQQFISGVLNAGYRLKGPFFYSLNNLPMDEIVDIEMFLPIFDSVFQLEGYDFSSYFLIENLFKTVVLHDFENLTELAYAELVATIKENHLEINTPFYHILPKTDLKYVEVLVGF
ncbi:DUF5085 family protein [Streptococcus oricebi]|uniref:DUF5085 domain-containing protein n=1 Tax=Streptococcus oricebi TaxID=1547447 RepID=A0ABS5B5F6_9STRE|nr:DUF5085 family protein [Streptococcus oricebi]MBP2624055.1 DUF5085 domain-containing protein [Streptococcus oricebi]